MSDLDDSELVERFQAAEELYEGIFLHGPVPMTLTNAPTQRFTEANSPFFVFSGFTRAEFVGKTSDELDLWVDPDLQDRISVELHRDGASGLHSGQMRIKGGDLIECRVHFALLDLKVGPCVLSTFLDTL